MLYLQSFVSLPIGNALLEKLYVRKIHFIEHKITKYLQKSQKHIKYFFLSVQIVTQTRSQIFLY